MEMTQTEKRLFKEKIIREYQLQQEQKQKKPKDFELLLKKLGKIAPFSVILGVGASIIFIIMFGLGSFFQLFLSGIIWITIISTIVSTIIKIKG